ncbi:hypothetical protein LCGC14_1441990 [marine sediment metagenome]|uniref:Uncharacterized protein n=1 Tax=marine sediment metagenome TaxID=412755 RepID=A0A0F9K6P1_9ZZZZ
MKTSALLFLVGLLAGFIAGVEYGRRQAANLTDELPGNLVGALMDTIGGRVRTTREKANMAEMKSTLRNLWVLQEGHLADHSTYGSTVEGIGMTWLALGVTIELSEVGRDGYRGTARHADLPNVACYIEIGSAWQGADGTYEGLPWCDDRRR